MRLKLFVEFFLGELAGFAFVQDRELRVEAKFVKMFANELEAETVQRADVREVEERESVRGQWFVVRLERRDFSSKLAAEALAHFGGGGLGESDDEHFVERRAFAGEAVQATLDEGL